MEVYKRETQEVIKRFLARRLGFPECIAALDAALAGLVPRLTGEELPELRAVILGNNEIVVKGMARATGRGLPVGHHEFPFRLGLGA